MCREIELRENLIGTGFIEPPQMVKKVANQIKQNLMDDMEHRVTILGEIATTSGFSSPNTYVLF